MNDKCPGLECVQQRMWEAADRAGRNDTITLVAVSKTRPLEEIVAAYQAGVRHFGENRTEELASKAQALAHLTDLKWHFIGQLQSRQAKEVARFAQVFHAVDRLKIAERLSGLLQETGRELQVYIQMNVSGEQTKGGLAAADWERDQGQTQALIDTLRAIIALPNLKVAGLMTMAPLAAPDEQLRLVFGRLSRLSQYLNTHIPEFDQGGLSMGMSGDFEIAIEQGATLVRIGNAIFGAS